ncbi:hypothetical protein DQ181_07010 [Enterococcus faecium]|nr:hypothetical protein [Enterococcus faecium]
MKRRDQPQPHSWGFLLSPPALFQTQMKEGAHNHPSSYAPPPILGGTALKPEKQKPKSKSTNGRKEEKYGTFSLQLLH